MTIKRVRPSGPANASRKRVKVNASQRALPAPNPQPQNLSLSNTTSSQPLKYFPFGEGTAGELGFGNVRGGTEISRPRHNRKLDNLVAVVAGGMHCVALDTEGRVLTWGGNDKFALGRETPAVDDDDEDDLAPGLNPLEATPFLVDALPAVRFVQVAAGDCCTFALSDDGLVYGWGTFSKHNGPYAFTLYGHGQPRQECQKTPMRIPGLQDIVQICAGADFALALDMHGYVWSWGTNEQSETGLRLYSRRRPRHPDEILLPHRTSLTRIRSIHAGLYHAFAIDTTGRTWAWGLNNFGQTGISGGAGGDRSVIETPQRVRSLADKSMKTIVGGNHHSVGMTTDGECLVWGRIDAYQTGIDLDVLKTLPASDVLFDDNNRPRILLRPTTLPIPRCTTIAAGTDHSIAVTDSGRAYSWGFNSCKQCGQGSEDQVPTARLMEAKTIAEEKIVMATAGGQFSMIGALPSASS